jgi:uncharacterized protein
MRFAAALIGAFLLLAPAAWAAPKFPALTGRVVDDAQLLSPATEQKLTGELAALEQQTGHQVVVATLPDLQGYPIEDYGYQLLRTWGIGRKGQDDGVILIVAPKERKVRIEVGYGLEPVLTDALSSLIIQRKVLPAFKAGKYEQGVVDGAEAIVAQLGLPADQAKAAVAEAEQQRVRIAHPEASGSGGGGLPLIVVLFVAFWLISGLLRVFGGRRRFGGGGGGLWWLLPLFLSSGSRRDGWGGGGFGGGSSFGGGGFSGGGGSGGGGGASGSW